MRMPILEARSAGIAHLLLDYGDRLGFSVDIDGRALFPAAVDDAASLEAVGVRSQRLVPAAEGGARLGASQDLVLADEVVRVRVAERHAIAAIFDDYLLVESVPRAPAEPDALGAAPHPVAPDHRAPGPRARVKGEPRAIVELAVLDEDVVRHAPDDAVAAKLTHGHPAQRDPDRPIEASAPVVEGAAIDHLVVGPVAADRAVVDRHVGDAGALEQR